MESAVEILLIKTENKVIRLQTDLLVKQAAMLVEYQADLDRLNRRVTELENLEAHREPAQLLERRIAALEAPRG